MRARAVGSIVIIVAAAGCGRIAFDARTSGGGGDDVDGGTGDGGPGTGDGGGPGGPEGAITLATTIRGAPAVGVVVWTNHPDGTLDDTGASDATGMATVQIEPGGTASAMFAASSETTTIESVAAAQPGDTLAFTPPWSVCGSTSPSVATLTWPTKGTQYNVETYCGTLDTVGASLSWHLPTGLPTPNDVVVQAFDASNIFIDTNPWLGATVTNGTSHPFTAGWSPVVSTTFGFSNLPTGVSDVALVLAPFTPLDTEVEAGALDDPPPMVSGGTATQTLPVPNMAFGRVLQALQYEYPDNASVTVRHQDATPVMLVLPPPPPILFETMTADQRGASWVTVTAGNANELELDFTYDAAGATPVEWTLHAPNDGRTSLSAPAAPATVPAVVTVSGAAVVAIHVDDADAWSALRVLPQNTTMLHATDFVAGDLLTTQSFEAGSPSTVDARVLAVRPRVHGPKLPVGDRE